eukprot:6214172-Pleurochrysis_carterae.AAC.7
MQLNCERGKQSRTGSSSAARFGCNATGLSVPSLTSCELIAKAGTIVRWNMLAEQQERKCVGVRVLAGVGMPRRASADARRMRVMLLAHAKRTRVLRRTLGSVSLITHASLRQVRACRGERMCVCACVHACGRTRA